MAGGLPRFLRAGLEKALEKSPARRFRDAGAMAQFFKKEKLSWPQRLFFSVKRGPLKWALAVLALAALLLFAYFATFGSRAVHVAAQRGSRLEAHNRFGVKPVAEGFRPLHRLSCLSARAAPVPCPRERASLRRYQRLRSRVAGQVIVSLLAPAC